MVPLCKLHEKIQRAFLSTHAGIIYNLLLPIKTSKGNNKTLELLRYRWYIRARSFVDWVTNWNNTGTEQTIEISVKRISDKTCRKKRFCIHREIEEFGVEKER